MGYALPRSQFSGSTSDGRNDAPVPSYITDMGIPPVAETQLDADTQDGVVLTNVAGATEWFSADGADPQTGGERKIRALGEHGSDCALVITDGGAVLDWEKLNRATLSPASMSARTRSSESTAGPSVATIFVFLRTRPRYTRG